MQVVLNEGRCYRIADAIGNRLLLFRANSRDGAQEQKLVNMAWVVSLKAAPESASMAMLETMLESIAQKQKVEVVTEASK